MISRHFVTIENGIWGQRQVHYQMAGHGPCLLLLHQAPLSSQEMLPLLNSWSNYFTCIAPDHPGFGLSDPSGNTEISIEELAIALLEVMDALGVEKAAVYGVHTGACIGVALAALAPERIWACVANGYVVVTPEERADLLANYLPAMKLTADGSHLSWLWWRVREKLTFAPWYRPSAGSRLNQQLPDLAALQEVCLEMLRSEDQYRIGYRAAFTFDGQRLIDSSLIPTLVVAAEQDALAKHVKRIQSPPEHVQLQNTATFQQAEQTSLEFLIQHGNKEPNINIRCQTHPKTLGLYNEMTTISGRQLRVQRYQGSEGKPVLLLHDSIGNVEVIGDIAKSFIGFRPLVMFDLPGQGESDYWPLGDEEYLSSCLTEVLSQLSSLGISEFDCVGVGTGGHLGIELKKLAPEKVGELAIIDPIFLDDVQKRPYLDAENEQWQPQWDGVHLIELWYRMRDECLFWPWFKPDKGQSICQYPRLNNENIQRRVLAFLKAPERTIQSVRCHSQYSLKKSLDSLKNQRVFLCAAAWSPCYESAKFTGITNKANQIFMELPEEIKDWGKTLDMSFKQCS